MTASTWVLRHADGSPYLTRHVVHGVDALEHHDPEVLTSEFVHEIHTADGDRHMHDHPWSWAVAVVLSGGYTERRGDGSTRTYRAGGLNILRPGEYHSIVAVLPNTVTHFLVGRETSDWGFLVDGVHVPHREYFKRPDVQRMTHERIA